MKTAKSAKLLGHQVHPMLVVFPLGLFAVSVFFDIAYLATDKFVFAETAYWNILAGVIGGLAAAVFGVWDWLTIPAKTRAKRIGVLHGLINVVVVGLFTVSWLIRGGDPLHHAPPTAALALSFIAIGLVLVSGWLGGELVERMGVGVSEQANANAPSSLQRRAPNARRRRAARAT